MLKRSSEATLRKRTGIEIEKSVFQQKYKNQPEILKKARFFTVRTRDPTTGKWKLQEVTRIYDHEEGICAFEDVQKDEVEENQTLENGAFDVFENQAERVMDDTVQSVLHAERGGRPTLRASDVAPASSQPRQSTSLSVSPPSKAERKNASLEDNKSDESSSDELSPLERTMLKAPTTKRQKTKEGVVKAKGGGGDTRATGGGGTRATGGGGGGGAGGGKVDEKSIQTLLAEVDGELTLLKQAEALDAVKDEALASLATRVNQKKNILGKKTSKDRAALHLLEKVNECRMQLSGICEFIKAVKAFVKKPSRKAATTIGEKMHALKASGVTTDMLPEALSCYAVLAIVFVLASDHKWDEAVQKCKLWFIVTEIGSIDVESQHRVQNSASTLLLAELVRWTGVEQFSNQICVTKLYEYCVNLLPHSNGQLIPSLVFIFGPAGHSSIEDKSKAPCISSFDSRTSEAPKYIQQF